MGVGGACGTGSAGGAGTGGKFPPPVLPVPPVRAPRAGATGQHRVGLAELQGVLLFQRLHGLLLVFDVLLFLSLQTPLRQLFLRPQRPDLLELLVSLGLQRFHLRLQLLGGNLRLESHLGQLLQHFLLLGVRCALQKLRVIAGAAGGAFRMSRATGGQGWQRVAARPEGTRAARVE